MERTQVVEKVVAKALPTILSMTRIPNMTPAKFNYGKPKLPAIKSLNPYTMHAMAHLGRLTLGPLFGLDDGQPREPD